MKLEIEHMATPNSKFTSPTPIILKEIDEEE